MTMELIMYQVSFVVDCRVYESDLNIQYYIHYAHNSQYTVFAMFMKIQKITSKLLNTISSS